MIVPFLVHIYYKPGGFIIGDNQLTVKFKLLLYAYSYSQADNDGQVSPNFLNLIL